MKSDNVYSFNECKNKIKKSKKVNDKKNKKLKKQYENNKTSYNFDYLIFVLLFLFILMLQIAFNTPSMIIKIVAGLLALVFLVVAFKRYK